jgi:hypothetical protein
MNKMKIIRYFLLAILGFLPMATMASDLPASIEEEKSIECITELKRDITVLNLLNGLHLTGEQQAALLQDARNAQKVRDNYRGQFNRVFPDTKKSLEDLKSQLIAGEVSPGNPTEERAKQANDEMKRIRESYVRDDAVIEQHVSTILTDGQKQIIEEFRPCLIPPKNLKNPTRAGQANDLSGIERMLAKVRTVPDEVYEQRIDKIIDRQIAKYEKHYEPLDEEIRDAAKADIRSALDDARAMSDVDFELNKEALAERIDLRANRQQEDSKFLLTHGKRLGKIARFLLDERMIPLLEQKVTSAGTTRSPVMTTLSTIDSAENCRLQCGSKK